MMRRTWDETWMDVARVMARRSACARDQVGAVIIDPRNRVVATSYNGPPAGFRGGDLSHSQGEDCFGWCERGRNGPTPGTITSYEDCPSLHAEANALSVCDRSMREGGSIYVTGHVCYACAKLIANSGLARVIVHSDSERDYRQPDRSYEFLAGCSVAVTLILPTQDRRPR